MPNCGIHNFNYSGAQCPMCMFGAGPRAPVMVAPVVPVVVIPPLAPNTLPGGANLIVQVARSGSHAFVVHNPVNLLRVYRGSAVEFRVSAQNTGVYHANQINFAPTVWGGTAGASGTGSSRTVTFNNLSVSNNLAGAQTVTMTFGGQTVTVQVVVFALASVVTPADAFLNRSNSDFGVDETVTLGFTTNPVGVTAAEAGGLQWRITNAPASTRDTYGLMRDVNTHVAPAGIDGRAEYIAPCRTHAANAPHQPSKQVRLLLAVAGGVSAGLGLNVDITIHKPSAHMTPDPLRPQRHHINTASAGFYGLIHLTPKNVSFRTLRWREGVGNLQVTGPFPVAWNNMAHGITAFGGPAHGTVGNGNAATGCQVNQIDNVFSGAVAYVPPQFALDSRVVGVQKWPIQWEYTYPDLLTGNWTNVWIPMQLAHHIATLYETGRMVMFKGHVACAEGECMGQGDVSKNMADPHVP